MAALLATFGLAAGFAGLGSFTNSVVGAGVEHYPGSVSLASEGLHAATDRTAEVTWQSAYQTPDELAVVRRWYAARLHITPASDMNPSGDCAWLSGSRQMAHFQSTTSVLLCALPHGTRIVVNRVLRLWP